MTRRTRAASISVLILLLVLPLASRAAAPRRAPLLPRSRVEEVIGAALALRGATYRFGADPGRDDEVDCSSLVLKAFRAVGLKLPRSSFHQSRVGRWVPLDRIRRGDRLYFKMTGREVPIDHTALYLGEGRMLHAFPGKDVASESLAPYRRYLVRARR